MTATYETTTTHKVESLEVSAEIDDVQDISFLDERNEGGVNDRDPAIRAGARSDAILRAQHGRTWGMVVILVRSQPDNVVRASLGGVDARDSNTYRANPPAGERSAAYFGEILSELIDEARDAVREDIGDAADALPVVDVMNGDVTGADVRDLAATAVDWWARP